MMMLCVPVFGFVSFNMKPFSVRGVKEFHTIQTFKWFEEVHHVELVGDVLELKTMAMYCLSSRSLDYVLSVNNIYSIHGVRDLYITGWVTGDSQNDTEARQKYLAGLGVYNCHKKY